MKRHLFTCCLQSFLHEVRHKRLLIPGISEGFCWTPKKSHQISEIYRNIMSVLVKTCLISQNWRALSKQKTPQLWMEIVHHWKIQWINEDFKKKNQGNRNLTAGPSSNATYWMPEFSELLQVRTPPTESSHQRALSSCGAAYYSHTPSEFNIEVILSNKHQQNVCQSQMLQKKCEEQRKKKMHHNHFKSIC